MAVFYLVKPDGSLQNFNKMLVEAGQTCVWDFSNNELVDMEKVGAELLDF